MAEWLQSNATFTDIGLEMLSRAQVGEKHLTITRVCTRETFESGGVSALRGYTASSISASSIKQEGYLIVEPAGGVIVNNDTADASRLRVRFANEELGSNVSYNIRQVIVFAQLDGEAEQPYFVAQVANSNEPDFMPTKETNPVAFEYDLYIIVAGVANVTIAVRTSGFVDEDTYNNQIAVINAAIEANYEELSALIEEVQDSMVGEHTKDKTFTVWRPSYTDSMEWSQSIDEGYHPTGDKTSERYNLYRTADDLSDSVEWDTNVSAGGYTHVEGFDNVSVANATHVEGRYNYAGYDAADTSRTTPIATHIEGQKNTAYTGWVQHIEGSSNFSNSYNGHIEGTENKSTNSPTTHVEGRSNKVSGSNVSSVGGISNTVNNATNSTVYGSMNTVNGVTNSHVFGHSNTVSNSASSSFISGGSNTVAGGTGNFVTGTSNSCISMNTSVMGGASNAANNGTGAVIFGGENESNSSNYVTVTGYKNTITTSPYTTVLGSNNTVISSSNAVVTGNGNTVTPSNNYTFVGGTSNNVSYSERSFVYGATNVASYADNSIVHGANNRVYGGVHSILVGGQANTVHRSSLSENESGRSVVTGLNNSITDTSASVITGHGQSIDYALDSMISGREHTITHNTAYSNTTGIQHSVLTGRGNTVSQTVGSMIAGHDNVVTDYRPHGYVGEWELTSHNVITGEGNTVYGANSSLIAGHNNRVNDLHDGIVVGRGNTVTCNNTTAANASNVVGAFTKNSTFTNSGNPQLAVGIDHNISAVNTLTAGQDLITASDCQTVVGKWNESDSESRYALIVGGGTSDEYRKNILALQWDGSLRLSGDIYVNDLYNIDGSKKVIGGGEITNIIKPGTGTNSIVANNLASGTANGVSSIVFNNGNTANGENSAAFGNRSTVGGLDSFVAGNQITSTGAYSATFGNVTTNGSPYTIVAGDHNTVDANSGSATVTGSSNTVETGQYSSVVGGYINSIELSAYSSILGGRGNTIEGDTDNSTVTNYNTVIGGTTNTITNSTNATAIGCTSVKIVNSTDVAIIGGRGTTGSNDIEDSSGAFIAGTNTHASIINGQSVSIISSGALSSIENAYNSAIVGGGSNAIDRTTATSTNERVRMSAIIGGYSNLVDDADYSVIVGGYSNALNTKASGSIIAGGDHNTINLKNGLSASTVASRSAIIGGYYNTVSYDNSAVIGGWHNSIDGDVLTSSNFGSVILGGMYNTESGGAGLIAASDQCSGYAKSNHNTIVSSLSAHAGDPDYTGDSTSGGFNLVAACGGGTAKGSYSAMIGSSVCELTGTLNVALAGTGLITSSTTRNQLVLGTYNEVTASTPSYAVVIGNGTQSGSDEPVRRNAFAITKSGQVYTDGDFTTDLGSKITALQQAVADLRTELRAEIQQAIAGLRAEIVERTKYMVISKDTRVIEAFTQTEYDASEKLTCGLYTIVDDTSTHHDDVITYDNFIAAHPEYTNSDPASEHVTPTSNEMR